MAISVLAPFVGTYTVTQTPTGLYSHTDDYIAGVYTPRPLVDYWTAAYDFGMSSGTKIVAVAAGVVVDFRENLFVGQTGSGVPTHGLGNFVTIRHNVGTANEFYATYAHLQQNGVLVEGGTVAAGQLIGYSGATGFGTGPHLHLQFSTTSFTHASGDVLAYATDAQDGLINFGGVRPGLGQTLTGTTVPPSQPDLVIRNASVNDLTVNVGQSVTVDWDVQNAGKGTAGSSYAGVYLSRDNVWSSTDIKVGGEETSSIVAGASDTSEDATFTVSSSISAGTWYVLVVADDGRRVTESSEINNVWSQAISVSPGLKPDLLIENARINDTTVLGGQTVTVSWDARNIGQGAAVGSDQFLFLSTDRVLSSSDRYLDREFLDTMSVGERDAEYEAFTMPTGLARGRYYVAVVADAGLVVAESNETNNIAWVTLDII